MTEDTYTLNNYEKIYYVNGLKVVVTNETVGEALKCKRTTMRTLTK